MIGDIRKALFGYGTAKLNTFKSQQTILDTISLEYMWGRVYFPWSINE